jgi:hypothetical protein
MWIRHILTLFQKILTKFERFFIFIEVSVMPSVFKKTKPKVVITGEEKGLNVVLFGSNIPYSAQIG